MTIDHRGLPARDGNTVAVGSVVARLTPPPGNAADLALYAAASGDSNPLHLDPAFARSAGFDRPPVHGMLGMAQFGRLLSGRFPPQAIKSLRARFAAIIPSGEQVTYEAVLAEDTGDFYRLSLRAVTAAGVVAITGEAIVAADAGAIGSLPTEGAQS